MVLDPLLKKGTQNWYDAKVDPNNTHIKPFGGSEVSINHVFLGRRKFIEKYIFHAVANDPPYFIYDKNKSLIDS